MTIIDDVPSGVMSIYLCLSGNTPCLIGRNGTIELEVLQSGAGDVSLRRRLELHAGIFPSTEDSVTAWIREYKRALGIIDREPVVAGWYAPLKLIEKSLLQRHCLSEIYIPLRSLEPYYVPSSMHWTQILAGKRVAVVSSFAQTMRSQIPKRKEIWGDLADTLLPATTQWFPIQTGYAPALAQGRGEWPADVHIWQEAVAYIVGCVTMTGAQICLIGCGGLAMIVGAELKRRGLQCVVMGGAIQVLFGIKGRRWSTHPVISTFWNEAWVWPTQEETPGGFAQIEGGCYWSQSQKTQSQKTQSQKN